MISAAKAFLACDSFLGAKGPSCNQCPENTGLQGVRQKKGVSWCLWQVPVRSPVSMLLKAHIFLCNPAHMQLWQPTSQLQHTAHSMTAH